MLQCGVRDVPMYMGAEGQMLGEPMKPTDFHGTDGLGDAPDAHPPASSIHVRLAPGGTPAFPYCCIPQMPLYVESRIQL